MPKTPTHSPLLSHVKKENHHHPSCKPGTPQAHTKTTKFGNDYLLPRSNWCGSPSFFVFPNFGTLSLPSIPDFPAPSSQEIDRFQFPWYGISTGDGRSKEISLFPNFCWRSIGGRHLHSPHFTPCLVPHLRVCSPPHSARQSDLLNKKAAFPLGLPSFPLIYEGDRGESPQWLCASISVEPSLAIQPVGSLSHAMPLPSQFSF